MALVFFIVGAALVLVVAFVMLGRVIGDLEHERTPAVYEVAAAVDYIADRLPDEVTARISYDDVERIVGWHLDWFGEVGVSSRHGEELAGPDVGRVGAVAADDSAVDAIVARSLDAELGQQVDALDVVCVLDLQMAYLAEIGAVGSQVERNDSNDNH